MHGLNVMIHRNLKSTEYGDPLAELVKLKKELQRVTEERGHIKKGRGVLRKPIQLRYTFIQDNQHIWPVQSFVFNFRCSSQGVLRMVKATHQ